MPAVSTMILNSLVMTGEKIIGDSLDNSERGYYLSRLNSMMDSWSNERLFIYSLSQTSFPLTASQGSYTIGNGGDFNMTRPVKVVDPCFIRDTDNYDRMVEIINADQYGKIVLKSSDGTYPNYLFFDGGWSATSTATIKLYPEPSSGLTLFINSVQPLGQFSTISHNVSFPPGYQRAIETNFSVEVSPGFAPISQELAKIAREAKAAIKTTNDVTPVLRLDYGVQGNVRSNILTGP